MNDEREINANFDSVSNSVSTFINTANFGRSESLTTERMFIGRRRERFPEIRQRIDRLYRLDRSDRSDRLDRLDRLNMLDRLGSNPFMPIEALDSINRIQRQVMTAAMPEPLNDLSSPLDSENVDISEIEKSIPQVDQEDYIDFRVYPLNLDWKDVEDESTCAYKILKHYGHFGLSLYSLFKIKDNYYLNLTYGDNFPEQITHRCLDDNSDLLKPSSFFSKLPPLNKIRDILYKNLFTKKDLKCIKVVLDIYESYYIKKESPLYENLLKQLIPTAVLFYSSIDNARIKDLFNYYSKIFGWGYHLTLFPNKNSYLRHYRNLTREYSRLGGTSISKFVK